MLKQQSQILTLVAIIFDIAIVSLSFVFAYALCASVNWTLASIDEYLWFLFFILPTWFLSLYSSGVYASMRSKNTGYVLASVFKAHLIAATVASSVVFFVEPHYFGRKLFLFFAGLSFIALISGKFVLRMLLYSLRRRGYNVRNILLVGSATSGDNFIRLVEEHAMWGFRIIGIVADDSESLLGAYKKYPLLGDKHDLINICKQKPVDEVVFCGYGSELRATINQLDEIGVTSRMLLDVLNFRSKRSEVSVFHDELPILTFHSKVFDAKQLLAKYFLDIIGASVGLLLFGLMLPFLAFFIRIDSPGPIFFSQERVGENGRRFRCWKLRSMYIDAEQRKKDLMAQNEMQGHMFKMKDDPRVTPVGRFLRKSSLDEFPQFWNVMRGEMSIVGTRPPTPDEVEHYENWHLKRICIKPGLTGLWQVTGRSQIQDFDEVARLDIRYIENWSIWLDIKIIFQTVWVVVAGRGAS